MSAVQPPERRARNAHSLREALRINYLIIYVPVFFQHCDEVLKRLAQQHCQAASTLVEVTALTLPTLLVKIEITAAQ